MDQSLNTKQQAKKSPSFLEKVLTKTNKALKSKAEWEDKDEFLDAVYWIRQVVGFVLGIIWGLLTFKGMFAIISFGLINALIVYIYTVTFQQVDEDEYGGIWDIIKEGFMTSLSTFLITSLCAGSNPVHKRAVNNRPAMLVPILKFILILRSVGLLFILPCFNQFKSFKF